MEYSIGEFSKRTNLSIYTLRYYENEGLIIPKRLVNNHRIYDDKDLAWILFIKRLKETDMALKDIKRFASLRAEGDQTIASRVELLMAHEKKLIQEMGQLDQHLNHLQEKIQTYVIALDHHKYE